MSASAACALLDGIRSAAIRWFASQIPGWSGLLGNAAVLPTAGIPGVGRRAWNGAWWPERFLYMGRNGCPDLGNLGAWLCDRASPRVRYRLGTVSVCPSGSYEQNPGSPGGVQAKFSDDLILFKTVRHERKTWDGNGYAILVRDESRFGVEDDSGRLITSLGVKPLGTWHVQSLLIMVEPTRAVFWQFILSTGYATNFFRPLLCYPDTPNTLRVDTAKYFTKPDFVPDNIILWFQPMHNLFELTIERFVNLKKNSHAGDCSRIWPIKLGVASSLTDAEICG